MNLLYIKKFSIYEALIIYNTNCTIINLDLQFEIWMVNLLNKFVLFSGIGEIMRIMNRKNILQIVILFFIYLSDLRLLFAEGKPATELAKKVKTEGLSGLNLFLAELYNNNRLMYSLVSTFSIIILGVIVTYIIGLFLKAQPHTEKHE